MNWDDYVAQLRRRRLSEAMGTKTGLFMSAWKNLEPVLVEMSLKPTDVKPDTYPLVLAKCKERIKGSRIGIVSRFTRDLLNEVSATPVTDDEVAQGERRAFEAHEAEVKRKRAEKAQRKLNEQTAGAAGTGGDDARAGDVRGGDEDSSGDGGEGTEDGRQGAEEPSSEEEKTSAGSPENEMNEQQQNEEEFDEEGEEGEEEIDEVPPSRRPAPRARVQQQPQVIVVQQKGQMRNQPQARRNSPPQPKFVKPQVMVRISKRSAGGKTIYINDYTSDEIGQSLKNFLKEQVDPEYSEPNGVTEYLVNEVFPDGREGAVARHTIASPPQQGGANGVDQIRDALDLVNDLRADAREEARANAEVMGAAKKTAAGSGDFQQLFTLMMMEKMFKPQSMDPEQLVKMVVEKLQPQVQHAPPVPMQFPQMPIPAPQFLPPPAPNMMDEVTKAVLLKSLNPQPGPMDEVMKIVLVKALTGESLGGANGASHGLTEEKLKQLLAQYTAPKAPEAGAIDSALGTFEKLSTMVQTLAPKLNAGGITGAIQGVLTPDLQKAIGNMLAGAIPPGGMPGAGANGLPPGQQVVQGQAKPPAQPEFQLPAEVRQGQAAIRIAQTREFQLEATANLVTTMYMMPMFQPTFEPALKQLLEGNPRMAQEILLRILQDTKPELATGPFIDDVARSLGKRFGVDIDEMVRTAKARDDAAKVAAPPAQPAQVQSAQPTIPIQSSPWDAQIEAVKAKEKEQAEIEEKRKQQSVAAAQAAVANAASPENAPPVQPLGVQNEAQSAQQLPANVPTTPPPNVPTEPVQVTKFEKEPARPSA